jgi:hypothetical protein
MRNGFRCEEDAPMNRAALILAAFVLLSGGAGQAKADLLVGPVLSRNEVGHVNHGIRFTALADGTLDSFLFQNQGQADLVTLETLGGVVLDSAVVPAGDPSFVVSAGWDLAAGTQYRLLGHTTSNGKFAQPVRFPQSDADLTVTAGIFSDLALSDVWGDFNNLATTQVAAVPGPSSCTLLSLATLGLIGYGWRRKRATSNQGRTRLTVSKRPRERHFLTG